jgi:predicted transcriptional regulator
MMATNKGSSILDIAAELIAAYVRSNSVPAADLPRLLSDVYTSLQSISGTNSESRREPAIDPKKSVHRDHLVCLEDGKRFRTLTRHLQTVHGLRPEQYRLKWNLPPNYPMNSADYADTRSALAKRSGLGRNPEDVHNSAWVKKPRRGIQR